MGLQHNIPTEFLFTWPSSYIQSISLQRLFLQDILHTEVIPTQRLDLQHNIPTEFLSTLPSLYIQSISLQRLFLQDFLHTEVIPTQRLDLQHKKPKSIGVKIFLDPP